MCLYVRRTVKPGGKTARMISPAKLTGTRDGTGAQVGPTLGKHKADMHVCACISLINHSKHIPSFAKTFSLRDFLLLLLLHLHLCRNNTIKNLSNAFNSVTGINKCPEGSKCSKWTDVFPTPKSMCEEIWSNSYIYTTYTKTSGKCMQLWFTGTNPNKKVAEYYLNNGQQQQSSALPTLLFLAVTSLSVMIH